MGDAQKSAIWVTNKNRRADRIFGQFGLADLVRDFARIVPIAIGRDGYSSFFAPDPLVMPANVRDYWYERLMPLRGRLFFGHHGVSTPDIVEARRLNGRRTRFLHLVSRAAPSPALVYGADRLFEARFRRWEPIRALATAMAMGGPGVFLNASTVDREGGYLYSAARQAGLRCVAYFNFDYLKTKSPVFGRYDRYLVWGEHMQQEVLSLYPRVSPSQVDVVGTPQFDCYFREEFHISREELCRRLNLDPARPILFYVAMNPPWGQGEPAVVEDLAQALYARFGRAMPNLIVRPHPADPDGRDWDRVRQTTEGRVVIQHPGYYRGELQDDPTGPRQGSPKLDDDHVLYTNLVRFTDVGLAFSSTVVLEWLLLDRPVALLGWDSKRSPSDDPPKVRVWDFEHFRPVVASRAARLGRTLEETVDHIAQYLERPERDAGARAAFSNRIHPFRDGRSAARVAAVLRDMSVSH